MKKSILVSIISLGMIAFSLGFGTHAWFTSQATSQDNLFETGSLEIGAPLEGTNAGFIGASNMKPGDSVTQSISVINRGTLPYKYKISAVMTGESSSELLYNKLQAVVSKGDIKTYEGSLGAMNNIVVDSNVPSGTTQPLTFTISLPTDAGNEYQDLSTAAKFVFDATQTDNTDWN